MGMLEKFNQKFLSNPILTAEWGKTLNEIEKKPKNAYKFLENLNLIIKDITNKIYFNNINK